MSSAATAPAAAATAPAAAATAPAAAATAPAAAAAAPTPERIPRTVEAPLLGRGRLRRLSLHHAVAHAPHGKHSVLGPGGPKGGAAEGLALLALVVEAKLVFLLRVAPRNVVRVRDAMATKDASALAIAKLKASRLAAKEQLGTIGARFGMVPAATRDAGVAIPICMPRLLDGHVRRPRVDLPPIARCALVILLADAKRWKIRLVGPADAYSVGVAALRAARDVDRPNVGFCHATKVAGEEQVQKKPQPHASPLVGR